MSSYLFIYKVLYFVQYATIANINEKMWKVECLKDVWQTSFPRIKGKFNKIQENWDEPIGNLFMGTEQIGQNAPENAEWWKWK